MQTLLSMMNTGKACLPVFT